MSNVLGDWVTEWAVWLGIACSVIFIIGACYGAVKWARKQLKDAILEDVTPALDHIHDCMERTGQDATVAAKVAANEATRAHVAAALAEKAATKAEEAVVTQVTNGKGAMPAFGGRLTDEDIANVATYVITKSGEGWD